MQKTFLIENRTEILLRLSLVICLISFVSALSCGKSEYTENVSVYETRNKKTDRGEEIVGEYLKRDFAPFRHNQVRLTIEPDEGKKEIYVLEIWRKQTQGETLTLTRVLEPKEDSDIAALTIEKKGEPTVNVNYIASQERFRESGTNRMFFGGLTSQELLGEWDKYKSHLLSEKVNKGDKIFEIESNLKPESESVIKRIVTQFSAEDYLPRELHLFNSSGREIRTFEVQETRTIDNKKKIVSKTFIRNHIHNTSITIEVLEMSFPENIPDTTFERENLKSFVKK